MQYCQYIDLSICLYVDLVLSLPDAISLSMQPSKTTPWAMDNPWNADLGRETSEVYVSWVLEVPFSEMEPEKVMESGQRYWMIYN